MGYAQAKKQYIAARTAFDKRLVSYDAVRAASDALRPILQARVSTKVRRIVAKLEYDEFIGLRKDSRTYAVGDVTRRSRRWDDGEPLDEYLHGTSTIGIQWNAGADAMAKAIQTAIRYEGKYLYIVSPAYGYYAGGEDPGEFVINDATVICRIPYPI